MTRPQKLSTILMCSISFCSSGVNRKETLGSNPQPNWHGIEMFALMGIYVNTSLCVVYSSGHGQERDNPLVEDIKEVTGFS